jgi:hypothetical protein
MEEIIATITDQGVVIETNGFKDNSCLKESEKLIKSLESMGIHVQVTNKTLKPEGYIKEAIRSAVKR